MKTCVKWFADTVLRPFLDYVMYPFHDNVIEPVYNFIFDTVGGAIRNVKETVFGKSKEKEKTSDKVEETTDMNQEVEDSAVHGTLNKPTVLEHGMDGDEEESGGGSDR